MAGARRIEADLAAGDPQDGVAQEVVLDRPERLADLRGGRSKVLLKHGWDGLPHYGTFGHLAGDTVLARVDALLDAGTLTKTDGRYPVLEAA